MNSVAANQHTEYAPSHAMGWFIALSLLLHLVVLLVMQREQEPLLFPAAKTQTAALALHLRQPEPAPVHKQKSVAVPPRKVITTRQPSRHPVVRQEHQKKVAKPEVTPTPAPAKTVTSKATPTAAAHPDSTARLENLKVTLQREITHYFNYPLLARRRGWQGEVILAFRLETDGTIINARVARSSGYGVLDRAALDALGKVKRIKHTLQHEQDMQLPVIYRLQEG